MKIALIGTGHVGLPTAGVLAHIGHSVSATDSDRRKVDELNQGKMPFFEDGLEPLVREGLDTGRLQFTDDPATAIAEAEAIFVCVGTPPSASGDANLSAVEQAVETVARHASPQAVVVHKSTVPAGTGQRVESLLRRLGVDLPVVSNPEFLREGSAVADSLRPARILIGTNSPAALEVMRKLYAPLTDAGVPLIATDLATAELAKHACNAFLSLKISFANGVPRIAELAGADVVAVADVMGSDPRIGRAFLDAGLGVRRLLHRQSRGDHRSGTSRVDRRARSHGFQDRLRRSSRRRSRGAVPRYRPRECIAGMETRGGARRWTRSNDRLGPEGLELDICGAYGARSEP